MGGSTSITFYHGAVLTWTPPPYTRPAWENTVTCRIVMHGCTPDLSPLDVIHTSYIICLCPILIPTSGVWASIPGRATFGIYHGGEGGWLGGAGAFTNRHIPWWCCLTMLWPVQTVHAVWTPHPPPPTPTTHSHPPHPHGGGSQYWDARPTDSVEIQHLIRTLAHWANFIHESPRFPFDVERRD